MELMREIGLFEEIQEEMPPLEQWKYFRYSTALLGTELAAVDHCDNMDGAFDNLRRNSPAFVAHLSQPILEALLWRKATQSPAAHHTCFLPHHQLEHLAVHADHVEVTILKTMIASTSTPPPPDRHPHEQTLQKRLFKYVVGADGARSKVRSMCGIELKGRRAIESFISIHFECPALWQRMHSRGGMLYFIFNPKVLACMVAHDLERGTWVAQVPFFPPLQSGEISVSEAHALIAASIFGSDHPHLVVSQLSHPIVSSPSPSSAAPHHSTKSIGSCGGLTWTLCSQRPWSMDAMVADHFAFSTGIRARPPARPPSITPPLSQPPLSLSLFFNANALVDDSGWSCRRQPGGTVRRVKRVSTVSHTPTTATSATRTRNKPTLGNTRTRCTGIAA
jgi:2-polyprenyl-6-methoxyphenol hydroxylase-like FAD-dependent oxidoreductase